MKNISSLGLFAGLLLAVPTGCSGDDGTTSTTAAGTDDTAGDGSETPTDGADDGASETAGPSDDSSGGTPGECPGIGGAGEVGGECGAPGDCASGVCLVFADVPAGGGECVETPADCNTRVIGGVYDFETGGRAGGTNVVVAAALQAATGPATATPIVEGVTDGDGHFDVTSEMPIMAQIGIVALVSGDGFYLTATGIASPNDDSSYDVGNPTHQWWAVPTGALTAWSDALAMDAEIGALEGVLPLGDEGGVVGLTRDGATGDAVGGAVVVPEDPDGSSAIVRYLQDDDTWGPDATGSSGIFVIINPSLAEEFHVEVDGATVSGTGTAGSASGAIFTLIMNVE